MPAPHALFFVYVWPEPLSSAAGVRTRALMRHLQEAGYKITAVSPSGPSRYSEELNRLGVETVSCDPNQSDATETKLAGLQPSLVVYDRFVMEEQFGWRARGLWEHALHVVDTQDLHSVRRAREKLAKENADADRIQNPSVADMGEDLLRELSSLHRSDACLVVSDWERALLTTKLQFPEAKVLHLPFPAQAEPEESIPSFEERTGFCFLGNFRHPPNLDSVRWTLEKIWPEIRSRIPNAELHLYGAYPPQEISQHKGKLGVFAHGPVTDHRAAQRKHRALLSPLRFGAGIKGKVLEAWACGTPVAGTSLTFEGMGANGLAGTNETEIAEAAVALHEEKSLWVAQQRLGLQTIQNAYSNQKLAEQFLGFLAEKQRNLTQDRAQNLIGQMLRHHSANSTKYFSRWIEAKNKLS